jgi:hypothetical protein
VDVDFTPTEHLGLTEEDRKVIFDISCTCNDGKTFIIEMQKGYQKYFRERALLETPFEKWIYLLKHLHNMKGIPPEFDEPLFKRLFLLAEICNFTPGELEQYYKSLNNMGDYYNILHTAKEEAERIGLERGLAKGIEQGRAEERAAIISLLYANGMDDESISKMLEMDLDAVRRITSNAATGK